MAKKASVLVKDLTNIPNIIASLGLGISSAQKAFNLDYLNSLRTLFTLAGDMSQSQEDFAPLFQDIVKAMAPSRYQFTESTVSVRMDLAQSMQQGSSKTLGASVGAIAVNAAFTKGFAYDYRAAAEVKTVIDAIPFDPTVMQTLLAKAQEIKNKSIELPDDAPVVDKAIVEQSSELLQLVANP